MQKIIALRTVLFALAVLLGGCSSLMKPEPPDWVLNPPRDTADAYWGVGEGEDLEGAKRTALKDVAAKLRVSISGNMESQQTVSNDAVDRSAKSRVSEVVQKTEFTNFSVEKSARSSNGIYTLVKVDRRAFVRETRAKFENASRLAQDVARDLARKTPLEQFRALRAALPNIENGIALGQLLRVAEPGFSGREELARLENLQEKALTANNALVFSLQFKPADADIAQVVTGFINGNGMRVAAPGEAGLLVSIASDARQMTMYGNMNVRLQVMLNLRDERKQNVATKEYLVNGNSLNGYDAARQDAMRELGNAMKKAGPIAGLGLKE